MNCFVRVGVLSLLIGSVFAETNQEISANTPKTSKHNSEERNKKTVEPTFEEAYSVPAVREVSKGINLDLSASFLYWYIGQESMDIGASIPSDLTANITQKKYQPAQYNPGFKVAVSGNTLYDKSFLSCEYTRISQSTRSTFSNLSSSNIFGLSWLGSQLLDNEVVVSTGNLSSHWKINLDMFDLLWGRPFYHTSQLKFIPSLGLKAFWLPQKMEFMATASPTTLLGYFKSTNWSLGPLLGFVTQWHLGQGIRLEAVTKGSLLFTSYHFSQRQGTGRLTEPARSIKTPSHTVVSATAELGMGFGWGRYLLNSRLFLDLSARYDFSLFWNQNTIHQISSIFIPEGSAGNLFMHGLTLNGAIQF